MNKITLGWLRVVLAAMVVDIHYGFFGRFFNFLEKKLQLSGDFSFCGDGNLAVAGFFILSGYLVAEILQKKYPSNNHRDFFHFVTSRYLRIFPLYLVVFSGVILINLVVNYKTNITPTQIFLNAILLPNAISNYFNLPDWPNFIIGPAWTLPLDLVFYPVGYLAFKDRKLLVGTLALLIFYYLCIWYLAPASLGTGFYDHRDSWWRKHFYMTIEPSMLAFLLGMVANLYLVRKLRYSNWVIVFSFMVFLLVCYFPLGLSYFGCQMIAIVCLMLLITALSKHGISKYESLLGSVTYAVYLVHEPVYEIMNKVLSFSHGVAALSFLVMLIISIILGIFVEENLIEKSRRKWLNSWKPDVTVLSDGAKVWGANSYAMIFSILLLVSCLNFTLGYFMY